MHIYVTLRCFHRVVYSKVTINSITICLIEGCRIIGVRLSLIVSWIRKTLNAKLYTGTVCKLALDGSLGCKLFLEFPQCITSCSYLDSLVSHNAYLCHAKMFCLFENCFLFNYLTSNLFSSFVQVIIYCWVRYCKGDRIKQAQHSKPSAYPEFVIFRISTS